MDQRTEAPRGCKSFLGRIREQMMNTGVPVWVRLSSEVAEVWSKATTNASELDADALIKTFCSKLKDYSKIYISCPSEELTARLKQHLPDLIVMSWADDLTLLKKIFAENSDADMVVEINGIFPLLSMASSSKLWQLQNKYSADYAYSEIHPPGTIPVFWGRDFLEQWELNEFTEFPIENDLSQFVEKNINKFHVEVAYADPDIRLLRLDFSCSSKRSMLETLQFLNELSDEEEILSAIEKAVQKNPVLLRQLPGYLELEFSSNCEYGCTFCLRQYQPQPSKQLEQNVFAKLIEQLDLLKAPIGLCVGGMGEPLEHESALPYLQKLMAHPLIHTLVLETNGSRLDTILPLADSADIQKLRVIVNINSLQNYTQLQVPPSGIALGDIDRHIKAFAEKLKDSSKSQMYLQMLKIIDNETEVDEIYAKCDELGVQFLFQKYNSYAGQMEEKRVSDMTPLERFPCWHLRRDLVIRADGSVPYCKQDMQGENNLNNIQQSSLAQIWANQNEAWARHYNKDYSDFSLCDKCDEYYTFNL
ncbi:MAG: spiro-SPASM protein [Leptospiraceae bacterium]|nr:spiro-SPASM protein [Leptospiraceae bacterium]